MNECIKFLYLRAPKTVSHPLVIYINDQGVDTKQRVLTQVTRGFINSPTLPSHHMSLFVSSKPLVCH